MGIYLHLTPKELRVRNRSNPDLLSSWPGFGLRAKCLGPILVHNHSGSPFPLKHKAVAGPVGHKGSSELGLINGQDR
jgi:hypothetical protein